MPYEITYETGLRPFVPDTKRGYWAKSCDFIFAGIALVFHLDFFSMSWVINVIFHDDIIQIPSYIFALVVYAIPIMIIQSFLGQFSSSSYISAFRVAPMFKGFGYVSFAINFCTTTYYSIFAVIPLVYLVASMQPTLPWSCSGVNDEEKINKCNMKFGNVSNEYDHHHIPSVLYFKKMFNDQLSFDNEKSEFTMAWQLECYCILFWSLVALIFYKCFETEKMGQLIRYSVCIFIGLLIVVLTRFSFLSGSKDVYDRLFVLERKVVLHAIAMFPVYGLGALGPGWGLMITLSSFNKFRTDIKISSWIISFSQMFVVTALSLLSHLTEKYIEGIYQYRHIEHILPLYFLSGSVMATLEWSHFWCILFFFMLFLGASTLTVIQIFSTMTTIFDEFPALRECKTNTSLTVIGATAHGITNFLFLSAVSVVAQSILNLILILIVLWVYGRTRFQRDIKFMINKKFSRWHIISLRYIVPLFIVLIMLVAILVSVMHYVVVIPVMVIFLYIFYLFPWLFVPVYAIYSIDQSIGSLKARFKHCCRPNNWYPVESEERQRYEEAMGNIDATHYLNQFTEEV